MAILSDQQLAAYMREAGMPAGPAADLVATSHPESGANDQAIQQGQPYATTGWGLYQITPGDSEPQFGVNQQLLNPWNNTEAAVAKWKSQGLSAWTTIISGAYLPYLPAAEQAVGQVYGMPESQVRALTQQSGYAQTTADSGSGGGGGGGLLGGLLGNPVGELLGLIPNLFNTFDWVDLAERFGLILLGGLLVLLGIWVLAGKEVVMAGVKAAGKA